MRLNLLQISKIYFLKPLGVAIAMFIGSNLSAQIRPTNNVVYVSPNGDGDGSSWESTTNLADALKWAKTSSEWNTANELQLWLLEGGNYVPKYRGNDLSYNTSNTPLRTFVLVKNVQIYGGFKGTESSLDELNESSEKSIISGDILGDDVYNIGETSHNFENSSDNATHVFVGSNDLGRAILYNVIIQGSNGYSSGDYNVNGQGINNQYGGGIYLDNAKLSVQNSIIRYNKTRQRGAGVYIEHGAKGYFHNVLFAYNQANTNDGDGGAVFIKGGSSSELHLLNSTLVRNFASDGGAIRIDGSETVHIYNSIIYDNHVRNSGASISKNSGSVNYATIKNNIIAGINQSDNFQQAPGYDEDFKLTPNSFAYNRGNNAFYTNLNQFEAPSKDLALNDRRYETIDLGAYEYHPPLGVQDMISESIDIYPTHFQNELNIQSKHEIKLVTFSNVSGQVIFHCKTSKINTSHLPKGVYILTVETHHNKVSKKVIKN